jgi:putative oxidoreductase
VTGWPRPGLARKTPPRHRTLSAHRHLRKNVIMPPSRAVRHSASPGRGLNIALWGAQVLLFVGFVVSGVMKLGMPLAELAQWAPWTAEVSPAFVRFVGAAEVLGAVGVLLPAITRIQPALTSLAALGLATIAFLAVGFHLLRGEPHAIAAPAILGALAAFVAWGRALRRTAAPSQP